MTAPKVDGVWAVDHLVQPAEPAKAAALSESDLLKEQVQRLTNENAELRRTLKMLLS